MPRRKSKGVHETTRENRRSNLLATLPGVSPKIVVGDILSSPQKWFLASTCPLPEGFPIQIFLYLVACFLVCCGLVGVWQVLFTCGGAD